MHFRSSVAILSILLAMAVLATGCGRQTPVQNEPPVFAIDPVRGHLLKAQDRLPILKITIKDQTLDAEIARHPIEIATGMMFRTNMLENEAMLFVFDAPGPRSFYMRNCYIPLSGAYITPGGEIFQIIDMKPHDESGIPSYSDNIQFVLEVPHGWFERHNIQLGDVVRTERGSLQETFFGNR
jgi:uncharacterized membrane protein (UPF0127 family)